MKMPYTKKQPPKEKEEGFENTGEPRVEDRNDLGDLDFDSGDLLRIRGYFDVVISVPKKKKKGKGLRKKK